MSRVAAAAAEDYETVMEESVSLAGADQLKSLNDQRFSENCRAGIPQSRQYFGRNAGRNFI
nr:hypothetical protein [uncultured Shinella sp.]